MEFLENEYDGWVLKLLDDRFSWFVTYSFRTLRKEVIEYFEGDYSHGDSWAKARRNGEYKIVKVRLRELGREMLECPDTHLIVWDEDKYEYSCCRCGDKFVEFKPMPLPTPDKKE